MCRMFSLNEDFNRALAFCQAEYGTGECLQATRLQPHSCDQDCLVTQDVINVAFDARGLSVYKGGGVYSGQR